MGWQALDDGSFAFSGNLAKLMQTIEINYRQDVKKPLIGQRPVDLSGYTFFVALGLQDMLGQMAGEDNEFERRIVDEMAACHTLNPDGSASFGLYPLLDLICERIRMDYLLDVVSDSEFRHQILENGMRQFGRAK